ncbi:3656_t:CDS:10 [Paraglomus occultum]|uniref:3656_t:CDS:1 n=1 Tax=Paraglomus occultum TaxID=144539 RepID=A0A9N8WKD9_9GLOM|nr:3656_t:CDS:10 [Paraglomus occultum]
MNNHSSSDKQTSTELPSQPPNEPSQSDGHFPIEERRSRSSSDSSSHSQSLYNSDLRSLSNQVEQENYSSTSISSSTSNSSINSSSSIYVSNGNISNSEGDTTLITDEANDNANRRQAPPAPIHTNVDSSLPGPGSALTRREHITAHSHERSRSSSVDESTVEDWTINRVVQWLEDNGFGNYKQHFIDNNWYGNAFFALTNIQNVKVPKGDQRFKLITAIRKVAEKADIKTEPQSAVDHPLDSALSLMLPPMNFFAGTPSPSTQLPPVRVNSEPKIPLSLRLSSSTNDLKSHLNLGERSSSLLWRLKKIMATLDNLNFRVVNIDPEDVNRIKDKVLTALGVMSDRDYYVFYATEIDLEKLGESLKDEELIERCRNADTKGTLKLFVRHISVKVTTLPMSQHEQRRTLADLRTPTISSLSGSTSFTNFPNHEEFYEQEMASYSKRESLINGRNGMNRVPRPAKSFNTSSPIPNSLRPGGFISTKPNSYETAHKSSSSDKLLQSQQSVYPGTLKYRTKINKSDISLPSQSSVANKPYDSIEVYQPFHVNVSDTDLQRRKQKSRTFPISTRDGTQDDFCISCISESILSGRKNEGPRTQEYGIFSPYAEDGRRASFHSEPDFEDQAGTLETEKSIFTAEDDLGYETPEKRLWPKLDIPTQTSDNTDDNNDDDLWVQPPIPGKNNNNAQPETANDSSSNNLTGDTCVPESIQSDLSPQTLTDSRSSEYDSQDSSYATNGPRRKRYSDASYDSEPPKEASKLQRTISLRRGVKVTWVTRPSAEDVYHDLDKYFPGHDLDKPITEGNGSLVTYVNHRGETPTPPVSPTTKTEKRGAPLQRYKSIRSQTTSAIRAATKLKRKATKFWDKRVVEMRPGSNGQSSPVTSPLESTPDAALTETGHNECKKSNKISWIKGELIGKGTFGKVYLALNVSTSEMIAVKQIELPKTKADRLSERQINLVKSFYAEIELLKVLDHEHIVQYLGYDECGDTVNIFLEYVNGGSIGTCLRIHGRFVEPVVKSFTRQILLGLEYLHGKGILHRDIKADNILVDEEGCCKISDFGISKKSDHAFAYDNISNMSLQGTIFWMAPEVFTNGYNAKVDIWGLGCVELEMFTGKRPWEKYTDVAAMYQLGTEKKAPPIRDDIQMSAEARDMLNKCFTIEPELRPTAAELSKHPFAKEDPKFRFKEYIRIP